MPSLQSKFPPSPEKIFWPWTTALNSSVKIRKDVYNWPRITVVTPSFNQGNFLESTILSVLNQNYPNIEYIVIDGGSSDNSIKIINKYSKSIDYWCSEDDDGQYHAINKGFSRATGDIYCWINSDDMLCPWALVTVANIFMQLPEVKWITTLNKLLWDANGFCVRVDTIPGYSRDAFFDGCYLPHKRRSFGWIQQESTFWKRELWEKVGGLRTEYSLAADFDLWARFFLHSDLYGVFSPLGGFRMHENQRTYDGQSYIDEAEEILKKALDDFDLSYRKINGIHKLIGNSEIVRKYFVLHDFIFGKKYSVKNIESKAYDSFTQFTISNQNMKCINRFL